MDFAIQDGIVGALTARREVALVVHALGTTTTLAQAVIVVGMLVLVGAILQGALGAKLVVRKAIHGDG